MSINGISAFVPNPIVQGDPRTSGKDSAGSSGAAPSRVATGGVSAAGVAARGAHSMPVEAPEGTDPQLWSVLTTEERSFFARARTLGPVTYGPRTGRLPAGGPRGTRIDVRV